MTTELSQIADVGHAPADRSNRRTDLDGDAAREIHSVMKLEVKSACQRSASSYDDGTADGTTGLASHKARALVRGEVPFSTSVPARSADNSPGIHMAKIAVGA